MRDELIRRPAGQDRLAQSFPLRRYDSAALIGAFIRRGGVSFEIHVPAFHSKWFARNFGELTHGDV